MVDRNMADIYKTEGDAASKRLAMAVAATEASDVPPVEGQAGGDVHTRSWLGGAGGAYSNVRGVYGSAGGAYGNSGGVAGGEALAVADVLASRCMGCMEPLARDAERCPACGYARGSPPAEAYHLPAGTLLRNRYVVGRALGYGGFGITYLCFDSRLERKVALKEYLPGEFSSRVSGDECLTIYPGEAAEQFGAGLKQFIAEAQSLARFNNIEGIVDIFDTFLVNNTGYIVMQHLDGVTVKQLIRANGALPYETAREIIMNVLTALRVVHKEGVIHRDISPDNIFITRDGDVKLIDFGAARYATTVHTKSLSVILKPGYAPEEQYRSKGSQGPWSDIYATAATFYKMLTGETPPEALERIIDDRLKPPSELGVKISESAQNAMLNAMNVHIEDRTRSADEFIAALSDGLPVIRVAASRKSRDRAGRNVSAFLLAAGIVFAALVVAGGAIAVSGLPNSGAGVTARPYEQGMINTPGAVNKSIGDAAVDLERVGLKLVVEGSEFSDKTLAGTIMSQLPLPGEPVTMGAEVFVFVSRGRPIVPDVRDWLFDAARRELEKTGFSVSSNKEYSDIVAEGAVIRQSVAPGDEHSIGGSIELVVSLGPLARMEAAVPESTAPNFTGMRFDDAHKFALAAGFEFAIAGSEYNKEYEKDQIVSQDPPAGAPVGGDIPIQVVVSLGRAVPVPSLANMERAVAEDELQAAGLVPVVEEVYSNQFATGVVARQEPEPRTADGEGALVEPGSSVRIFVSLGALPETASPIDRAGGQPAATARPTATARRERSSAPAPRQTADRQAADGAAVSGGDPSGAGGIAMGGAADSAGDASGIALESEASVAGSSGDASGAGSAGGSAGNAGSADGAGLDGGDAEGTGGSGGIDSMGGAEDNGMEAGAADTSDFVPPALGLTAAAPLIDTQDVASSGPSTQPSPRPSMWPSPRPSTQPSPRPTPDYSKAPLIGGESRKAPSLESTRREAPSLD